jgi:hypothetical protein
VKRFLTRRRLIAAGVAMTAPVAAGLVYAAWLTGGSGSGYAGAGTAQTLTTVDASASTTGDLYPGGTGDVKVQIHNPNSYPVTVTSISSTGAVTKYAGTGGVACTDANHGVSWNGGAWTGSISVPANGDSAVTTLPNKAAMSNSSDNACQGAKFVIPVTLTGQSG